MLKFKLINIDSALSQKILKKSTKKLVLKISGPLGSNESLIKKNCSFLKTNSLMHVISYKQNSFFGTYSSNLNNIYKGLICGYKQYLEVRGVGYKFLKISEGIQLDVGYSSPILFQIHLNLSIKLKKNRLLKIFGNNLNLVKQTAARLKLFKKPEPYKGKGLRYLNDTVVQKEGKKKKK